MSATLSGITLSGDQDITRQLGQLTRTELPTALRNATNDTARDVIKRLERETKSVFDRPTPKTLKPLFLKDKATKERPEATIDIKDVFGKDGQAIINTLTPHIPGEPAHRKPKGMEKHLRRNGLLGPNQFLVPSRTAKLDRHGNIPGSQASKMLSDLNSYAYNPDIASQATHASKVRYIWGSVKPKGGKPITGIWLRSRWQARKPGALVMLVVDGAPTYGKRFHFDQIAKSYSFKVFPKHMRLAIEHALRRRS